MIPDLDIYRSANLLVKQHGEDAPIEAAMRGGPGRDLRHFRSFGHDATGLDGSMEFVTMARR